MMAFVPFSRSTGFAGSPIFIGGDGRSGTTLLSVILDSHPRLTVGPELHFGGPSNLGPYLLECLDLIIANDPRAFGAGLKANPQFKLGVQFAKRCHRFGVAFSDLRDLVVQQCKSTDSKLSSFEDRCALINAIGEFRRSAEVADRWGIKIMRDILKAKAYAKLWPNARFLHIVRDGRDVAASQMTEHGTWGYSDIRQAAKHWAELITRVRALSKTFPILEIRYEDLVARPEPTLREVTSFLGIEWDNQLLNHGESQHSLFENPYNHPSITSVTKPINDQAVARYIRDLTDEQIAMFNKAAGEVLASLGYDVQ